MSDCRVDGCDETGFVIVNTDAEMLCIDHFEQAVDISYLDEPEGDN